jgi:beta-glucosidase
MALLAPGLMAQAAPWATPAAHQLADSLLGVMTLEEKVGQMVLFTSDWDQTGPTLREGYREDVQAGRVGAIFNAHTAAYNRELQRVAVEETRLGIPLLFGYDVIHGYKTIFPIPLGWAASWDLDAIENATRISAAEAAASGLHWTFAPMVDVARDPRWGRIAEGAGEDTYLGSLMAAAQVRGFQGEDLSSPATILACAKHFAAYGAAQAGRDYHTVDMSDRRLREVYLPPFKAAVDAGVATFMTAFNELGGVPASGNRYLLEEILRQEWGFRGFVVTDYTSINEMVPHGIVPNDKEAALLAAQAGVDMDMQGATYYDYLAGMVEAGRIPEAEIDASVRRILVMKHAMGLFDDPYRYSDEAREKAILMAPEHLEAARDLARKSVVLLKNQAQTLPLTPRTRVALIGPLADSKRDMLGSWSAAGEAEDCVTLREGLQARMGRRLTYAQGCEFERGDKSGFSEALAVAREAEVIVAVVGESFAMSGEAASRVRLDLPGQQHALLDSLKATGKPLVVVLMNGRPLAIPEVVEQADALLEGWFLGTQAGHALADVLLGDYNPAGRLTVSFPRHVGQVPIFYATKNTGRPKSEGKYTSKYLDMLNTPLFPFGYGLSYTQFTYGEPTVNTERFSKAGAVTLTVPVKNTGDRVGEEVVQLYVRDEFGSVTRPLMELRGFEKISLQPGETREVTFTLSAADLAFYTRDMIFTAEPGSFLLMVGPHAESTRSVRVHLTE